MQKYTSDALNDHNLFYKELENSKDKFEFIAKSIGKGYIRTENIDI
jgi:hypothetical protein